MSRQDLAQKIWRACDIMRRDDGTTGIMEYMEQLSWLLFLKSFENIEDRYESTAEYYGRDYSRVIAGPYRWSVWTGSRRKQAKEKVASVQQRANKARMELEDAEKQQAQTSKAPSQEKTVEIEQIVKTARLQNTEAQAALAEVKIEFAETMAWLEEEVRILYDSQSVEQGVLRTIDQQFNGQLDLTPAQFTLLRETEKKRGEVIASQLVKGLVDDQLLRFVDEQLFPYLRGLRGTPERDIIGSIFKEIPGNRMRSVANLKAVINLLDEVDFQDQNDSQIVSQIYEDLLSRLGTEGGIAGEFYTPRPIIEFMVKVIQPKIGETVYDPFCGSAGFLVEAYKQMVTHERTPEDHEILQRKTFYGQEKKPLPALLGMMNMILHGVLTPNITRVNTLAKNVRDISDDEQHDVILTNPPFGGKEGKGIQQNFSIPGSSTELLALQHIIAKQRANGRCGLVVPEGVLFRENGFLTVRQELLNKFNLYAIISLPAGVFANVTSNGTGPKTNLLFFEGTGPTNEIWYYEVNHVGFTLTKSQRQISANDLPDALKMLSEYRKAVQSGKEPLLNERCWIVPVEQIKELNYDLTARNPNKIEDDYTHRAPEVLLADIMAKHQRIGEIFAELQEWLVGDLLEEEL